MRILLALRHSGYTRHFGSTIELLGERGHEIVLVLGKHWRQDESIQGAVAKLGLDVPGLRMRDGVETHRRVERDLASALRNYLAYLWFLEPGLARAKKPRERSSGNVPPSLRTASAAAAENALSLRFLESKVAELERALPLADSYRQLVVEENPDAVVVSPLLERGVPQIGYLRAARELGIPTGLCVASWDNLTNKGPLFGPIDLVTVWNDSQKREAVELHRVPPERVAVTGAPLYDKWFGLSPARSRETFCRHVGLPSDAPYLLYVCSSGFIAPNEEAWILRWVRHVRGSAELADVPILVRPHPQKELSTESAPVRRLAAIPGVVIHPRGGQQAVTEGALADYFDSMYHSAAVIGVNTSAMIDAAFTGRGIYTLLARRFQPTQEGMLHFGHLLQAGGGLVHATRSADDHVEALARAVRGDDSEEAATRAQRFLADFIRPQGLDQPSTPRLADALESLASRPRRPPHPHPDPPREWLDSLAADLEPLFHIRKGRSIASSKAVVRRDARSPKAKPPSRSA